MYCRVGEACEVTLRGVGLAPALDALLLLASGECGEARAETSAGTSQKWTKRNPQADAVLARWGVPNPAVPLRPDNRANRVENRRDELVFALGAPAGQRRGYELGHAQRRLHAGALSE